MAGLLGSLGKADTTAKPATGGKATRPTLALPGLANYAALAMIAKQIEGILRTHPVKALAVRYFVTEGRKLKKTPQNPEGRDGMDATASVQLRRRNSNQPLDADAAALCDDLGIETVKHVIAPHTIRIKPALFARIKDDEATLDKLIAAGAKALGMSPADVFEEQDEESKVLVSDKSLDCLFALGTNHTDDRVMEILGKLCVSDGATISAKFQGSLAAAFEVARVEFAPTPAEMKAREAAAAEAGKASGSDAAPKAGGGSLMDALRGSLKEVEAEGDAFGLPPAGGAKRTRKGK